MTNSLIMWIAIAASALSLIVAIFKGIKISKADAGNDKMKKIAGSIADGARAFLKAEYKILAVFIVVVGALIWLFLGDGKIGSGWLTAICFLAGALFSIFAGFFGMTVATKANVRTASAAMKGGMSKALAMAFSGGSVMGLSVVGLGLLGISVIYFATDYNADVLFGFSLGASSIALFARVGGGIYTKAADVGADLVGKVEAGIPEDDPRNPAVIADNVGDNVGDVAGMGADLFESYVGSIISAIALGAIFLKEAALYAILLAATGIVASIIGGLFVRGKDGSNPGTALKVGTYVSSVLVLVGAFVFSKVLFGRLEYFFAVLAGLVVGVLIGQFTEFYTSGDFKWVKGIAKQSETGSATTIISGLSVGMESTVLVIIFIVIAIIVAFMVMMGVDESAVSGVYGIALAAVGMLSTAGITVAVDAYGPIADNAGGIAEMADLDPSVREVTDKLDAVGNTTAAMGKGFAIGSAALTALALFFTYAQEFTDFAIDLLDYKVVCGLLIGGMLTFIFSALTMSSVSKAANSMIEEVRRQFRTIPGLLEGKAEADYKRCVEISTKASLKQMILPGVIAIAAPVLVGILLGASALGGLLAGALVSGVLMAIFMSNAGGAWDNAKKYIESGEHGGKGSDAHKAAVVGDTVGDPFKDTSGPSINILIKLMTVVALVVAPVITTIGTSGLIG
ncbi:MAG: sodium-translocating pyrophosphatase [Clostridia bacterium]|nr:sodium-translocating pyrophosphatase [Clostridia bacterium]